MLLRGSGEIWLELINGHQSQVKFTNKHFTISEAIEVQFLKKKSISASSGNSFSPEDAEIVYALNLPIIVHKIMGFL
jgi:hypothetical protein